jgi:hypothetical protein
MTLVANTSTDGQGVIILYNVLGQILQKRNVQLLKGLNTIDLPVTNARQRGINIISLFINGQVAYTQKIIL